MEANHSGARLADCIIVGVSANSGSVRLRWSSTRMRCGGRLRHLSGRSGQVSAWQVEMGWPDIHWLARDLGWAGGSRCANFVQELE